MRERGSATLVVMAALLLVSVLMAGLFALVGVARSAVAREEARDSSIEALRAELRGVSELILDDPTPEADSGWDPVWARVQGGSPSGIAVSLEDLSGRLGINWIRKELLESLDVLKEDAAAVQQRREDQGLQLDIHAGYGDLIAEEALDRLFTPYSPFNVNVADEFALRRLYLERTGDSAGAADFHARIQTARIRRPGEEERFIEPEDLEDFLGPDVERLLPLVTAEPVINVNTAPGAIVTELLARYDVPAAAGGQLLSLRDAGEVAPETLEAALGEKYRKTLLHHYLGCRSRFWRIEASREGVSVGWVVMRIAGDDDGDDRLRLLEERVSP